MADAADPTFYRSPAEAIGAPPEELAYVAAFDPTGTQRDAMTVVDCNAESSSYGQVVGWTDLPTAGNELLRRLVAPERRRRDHLGVGDPVDDRERPEPRGPARPALRPPPQLLDPFRREADSAGRPRRRASDGAGAAARTRPAQDLGVRRRRDQRDRPLRLRVALAARRRPLAGEEGDYDPRRAGRRVGAAAGAAAVRRGAAARDRHRSLGRRPLALRVLLGNGRAQAVRRQRPAEPEGDRLRAPRWHRSPGNAPGRARRAAARRSADGRDQP